MQEMRSYQFNDTARDSRVRLRVMRSVRVATEQQQATRWNDVLVRTDEGSSLAVFFLLIIGALIQVASTWLVCRWRLERSLPEPARRTWGLVEAHGMLGTGETVSTAGMWSERADDYYCVEGVVGSHWS